MSRYLSQMKKKVKIEIIARYFLSLNSSNIFSILIYRINDNCSVLFETFLHCKVAEKVVFKKYVHIFKLYIYTYAKHTQILLI